MVKFTTKIETPRFPLTVVLLAMLFSVSECWETEISEKKCATLRSQNDLRGEYFIEAFKDGEESANLFQHLRLMLGWNITSSILVESGCSMEICNDTYFDGVCLPLEEGSYPSASLLLSNFTTGVGSVSCNCMKECKCEDIFMKKSSCARAYFKGGCKTCNSLYTELDNIENGFPEGFRDKVEAFRLRRGCTLKLYTDEDREGEEKIISDEIFENYNGTFSSYECECNDDEYVPRVSPPRSITAPLLVHIPESVDDVIKMLQNETYSGHAGLMVAKKSMENMRSRKNAYILVIGSVGGGKERTINMLFDNQNITKLSATGSLTAAVTEFRIPIPVDELGIANSELRVIITPGLGDTRGIEQDAKSLATLETYLENHEELQNRIPNVVLVFHDYNDTNFQRDDAEFINMLRGLNRLYDRITDWEYSNVIFVLSHFCSATTADTRQPTKRLSQFKQVIEGFSTFPKPYHLVVAEDKAKEHKLPLRNGFYKLPNKEYYPRNLLEKLELVIKNGGDAVGFEIFRTAFRDSENFNVTASHFDIVESSNPKVEIYLSLLSSESVSASTTTTEPPITTVQNAGSLIPSLDQIVQRMTQKERQELILKLQQEDYNEDRKTFVDLKLQELSLIEKIRLEEEKSERKLARKLLEIEGQLGSVINSAIGHSDALERLDRAKLRMEALIMTACRRIARELELKTMRHINNLSVLRNQMEALNEVLHHKLSLNRRALEVEQKRLDLIYNWDLTQNATASESQAKLLRDLNDLGNTTEVIVATQITRINSTQSLPSNI
ncbi:unnamed protein product [Orchesella dallaii]|uniref:AIG1-type G domain-containing protein n=1 Tax=Orchesella dallaii TaxID=48710 RepID=A0ABP1RYV1_9HEXA